MKEAIKRLKKEFIDNPDLIIKEVIINRHKSYVVFLETLSSQDKINEYILKQNKKNIKYLGSNEIIINNIDECEYLLYSGFTIIINKKEMYAIETRQELSRSISTNEVESSIKGPKNAFVENYQINAGLLKRRIKSSHLKIKNLSIGRLSNTLTGIFYIDNVVNKELVNNVYNKLKQIDIALLNSSENLIEYLDNKGVFPTVISTERPDRCASALNEGKIVILCDESATALILPAFLIDFINPFSDNYNKNQNINFTKVIRFICFILSAIIPAFYIAIINYNQEAIPTSLIVNFALQRDGVPFPAVIECFIMLIICEILRESDLRFPSKYGSAISILGALVLGDAAVSAGLVSPIMIIIAAITYIASLIFADIEVTNALRIYRFLFLILSSFLGLYGLLIGIILLIINLCNTHSFSYPYTFPLSPFEKNYFKSTIIKFKNNKRSKILSKNISQVKK